MDRRELGQVIATRQLFLEQKDGPPKGILVSIGHPRRESDPETFYCPYSITGEGIEKNFFAPGIDAIQSLQGALAMIGADLAFHNRRLNGAIKWKAGVAGDLGFPNLFDNFSNNEDSSEPDGLS